jgi:hypothetical protein
LLHFIIGRGRQGNSKAVWKPRVLVLCRGGERRKSGRQFFEFDFAAG